MTSKVQRQLFFLFAIFVMAVTAGGDIWSNSRAVGFASIYYLLWAGLDIAGVVWAVICLKHAND